MSDAQQNDLIAIDRELSSRSLRHYLELSFNTVEPSVEFMPGWHIDAICDHLEGVFAGDIKNLLINVPPGSMKSMSCCVAFPTWAWTKRPGYRMIYGSFSDDVARRDSLKARQLIESDWYQDRWGETADHDDWKIVKRNKDQWDVRRFSNSEAGFRYAVTVAGQVLGYHGHVQFADDPNKPDPEEISDVNLRKARNWWDGIMATRKLKGCARVIIMQRLHGADLAGHAIESGDYETLVIPMEHDVSRVRCSTSRGFEDPRTKDGECVWPARWDAAEVAQLKKDLGPRQAAAQLDQDPSPKEGAIFKQSMIQHYREPPSTRRLDRLIISVDATFKKTKSGSFVSNQVWGQLGSDCYLLDHIRARMSFSENVDAIRRLADTWPTVTTILVEDKANGPAIINTLEKELSGVVAAEPYGDKEARANAVEPQWAAGNVWLPDPRDAPWVLEFVKELLAFPVGKYDDQVDAMSQALAYLRRRNMDRFRKAMGNLGRLR